MARDEHQVEYMTMEKEEQIKSIDISLISISHYVGAGSFGQMVQLRLVLKLLLDLRAEIAQGTPWEKEMMIGGTHEVKKPSAQEVAERIIEDLNHG